MVFGTLTKPFFDPKTLANDFLQLFKVCFYVVVGHIPRSIALVLSIARLLVLAKPFGSI
jgi:hypothetical protein